MKLTSSLASAVLGLVLALGVAGCDEAEQAVDCADICMEADDCLDDFDSTECLDRCEDQPQSEVDACDMCLDDSETECSTCGASCAPLLI